MEMYDVIIIGKGPAGISAALYTCRANLKTLIVGNENSSLEKAAEIENYFGFPEPVSGRVLLDNGETQAKRLGADIIDGEVTGISFENGFSVKTSGGSYSGAAILIATGQPRNKVDIPGIKEFEGRGVSYCTTCDGFFYRNKTVGILGNGNYAIEEAGELETFTKDITIFTNGKELNLTNEYSKSAAKYKIIKSRVKMVEGGETLEKIIFEDGEMELNGLFVAYGSASSVDFAAKTGIMVKENSIVVDADQKTNIEGIYAAGDCCSKLKQISVAVGQGAVAGRAMIEYVKSKKKLQKTVTE